MRQYSVFSLVRASAMTALVGGTVGFALGLLMAPEEGRKARRRLAYRLESLADRVGRFVDSTINPETQGDARRTGDALVADARAEADRIRDDIDALLDEMRPGGGLGRTPSSLN